MIKAVLFDMDGVLIDTEKYLTQFWQQAAAEAGLSLTMEDCYQFRSFASKFASVAFQEKYGKELYLKARLKSVGERMNTIYVSDEELKEAVHIDIEFEE